MFYVEKRQELLLNLEMRSENAFKQIVDSKKSSCSIVASRLAALNPMAVLSRGYAAAFKEDGRVISGVSDLNNGDSINLKFNDGKAKAVISEINEELCE